MSTGGKYYTQKQHKNGPRESREWWWSRNFYRAVREEGEGAKPCKHWLWRPSPPTATPRDLCRRHFTHKASLSTVWFFLVACVLWHMVSLTFYICYYFYCLHTQTHTHTHSSWSELHRVLSFRLCSQINPRSWGRYLVHWGGGGGNVPSRGPSTCEGAYAGMCGDKSKGRWLVGSRGGEQQDVHQETCATWKEGSGKPSHSLEQK